MKLFTLIIYFLLWISWLYILLFSIKEVLKGKFESKSLFIILFTILIIDSLRTIIESSYFGTRLASQYGILPNEVFITLSNPTFLFIPKLINAIAAITIIILILKKWYPEKLKEEKSLQQKYEEEIKNKKELEILNKELDKRVKEKTKELEVLNKNLEIKIEEEIQKNKEKEQKLYLQSKMASMGEMLNNIAHQWRQPLSAISTISSGTSITITLDAIEKKEIIENLNQITKTAQHMSQTIEDFQNYFKPNKESTTFTAEKLINSTLEIISPILKSNYIDIKINDKDECQIFGPYNEYSQVLLNIFANAKDAFIENDISNRFINIDIYKKDEKHCVISITDTAGGIDNEIINRIFEPYFTTKHQGSGTGLGLYMSKEIIEKHIKGTLEVQNVETLYEDKLLKGSRFIITIEILE